MNDIPSADALRTAFRYADPETGTALALRLRSQVLSHLPGRYGVPERALQQLLGPDGAALREALCERDPRKGAYGTALRRRAAALGDPETGKRLYENAGYYGEGAWEQNTQSILTAILAAADPDDQDWYAQNGLVDLLLKRPPSRVMEVALWAPFPEVAARALVTLAPDLPLLALLDVCIALFDRVGVPALTELADAFEKSERPAADAAPDAAHRRSAPRGDEQDTSPGPAHPGLVALLRRAAAAPDPVAVLREHRPDGEWSDPAQVRAILSVRRGGHTDASLTEVALDWGLVRREHARRPFSGPALATLTSWPECPEDLVRESFLASPRATAARAARLPFAFFVGPEAKEERFDFADAVARAVRTGAVPVDRLLSEAAPAGRVLAALPYDHEPTRKAVGDLLAPLGTDPVNWLTFYSRLARAEGSATALIAEVAAPAGRGKRNTTWPRPLPASFPATAPEASRATFLSLFQCATEEAQISVVPHFDERAVQHLLVYGSPSDAVRAAVVAAHGVTAHAVHATTGALPAHEIEALLDLDEPAVDANLFFYCGISQHERVRMLDGRLRGGGTRTVPGELLRVLEEANLGHYRRWLTAGLASGDLGVARVLVNRLRFHTPAGRLRLLVTVWERGGPEAVRTLLDHSRHRLPVTLQRLTKKALDAPDGLAHLKEHLAAAEDPAKLLAYLCKENWNADEKLHKLTGDGVPLPWPALLTAHAEGTLPDRLVPELASLPDCPRDLLLRLLQRLDPNDRSGRDKYPDWLRSALRHGTLSPTDLLHHARPAEWALSVLLRTQEGDWVSPADWAPARAETDALIREHLGNNVEAWAIALQLLPTFTGSLAELISTVGAVAHWEA
ncbi:hypothetical protein [Streptomyces sp. NPDC003077]|uniref:hypothetical protein n=1 Tax=Streptomyces sp. NPDC003077 TaxID=3154443 RepID=UPI0033BCF1E2